MKKKKREKVEKRESKKHRKQDTEDEHKEKGKDNAKPKGKQKLHVRHRPARPNRRRWRSCRSSSNPELADK